MILIIIDKSHLWCAYYKTFFVYPQALTWDFCKCSVDPDDFWFRFPIKPQWLTLVEWGLTAVEHVRHHVFRLDTHNVLQLTFSYQTLNVKLVLQNRYTTNKSEELGIMWPYTISYLLCMLKLPIEWNICEKTNSYDQTKKKRYYGLFVSSFFFFWHSWIASWYFYHPRNTYQPIRKLKSA